MVFGLGTPELALILFAAFLLFGPKKLPELARSIGLAGKELKKAVKEIDEEGKKIEDATKDEEEKEEATSSKKDKKNK